MQLITEVVANVAPGATINDDGGSGPSPCSAPFKGDVYYGVYRSFDAPHDLAGTMLFDATVADLKGRGIKFAAPSTTGATGQDRNDIGSASLFGVEVIASAGTSRVQITIAAECGTP